MLPTITPKPQQQSIPISSLQEIKSYLAKIKTQENIATQANKIIDIFADIKNIPFDEKKILIEDMIKTFCAIDKDGKIRAADAATKIFKAYGDELEPDIRTELIIQMITSFGTISNYSPSTANATVKILNRYGNELQPEVKVKLIIQMMVNFCRIDNNGNMLEPDKAFSLLQAYYQELQIFLQNPNHKFLQTTITDLIKDSIKFQKTELATSWTHSLKLSTSVNHMKNPIMATQLLYKYSELLKTDARENFIINIMEYFCNINTTGNLREPDKAIALLKNQGNYLAPEVKLNFIIRIFENLSSVKIYADKTTPNKIRDPKKALQLLDTYIDKLDDETKMMLTSNFIMKVYKIDTETEIKNIKELIEKFPKLYELIKLHPQS